MTSAQPRVLLVDDNELNLFLLLDMLQELDVVPITAESGAEALEFTCRHDFALILLDIEMPGMDGYQVLNQLASNADTAEIPVIFMSANMTDADAKSHGTMLVPVDTIYKPVNKTLFLHKMSTYLELNAKFGFLSRYYREKIRTENATPEGMLALDQDGNIAFANPTATALLRTSLPQLIGLYFETLLERPHHEVDSNWHNSVLYQACKNQQTSKVEHALLCCGDGHQLVVSFIAFPLREKEKSQSDADALIVFQEIQSQEYCDDKLSALVNFDPLTRLINKDSFEEMAKIAIETMSVGESLALILWNLDHFDYINESLGYELGDRLMQAIAQRLSNCIPATSTLARIGGDEFALLLPSLANTGVAIMTAHALLTVFKGSFLVGGHEIFVSASAGIATCPESGTKLSILMRNADRALKKAKSNGRDRVEIYSKAMALASVASFQMATDLHQVLVKKQLFLSYKPVINLQSTKLSGVETRLYWRHPKQGVLASDEFQTVAEESGLMPAIGEWVLAEACRNWQSWVLPEGAEKFKLRVKMSLFHLLYRGFERALDTLLQASGFDPACFEFEISEASLNRDNLAAIVSLFKLLNNRGIRIILDDFGSNYLTLATLEEVEFHGVKLGGEFLRSTLATPRCDVVLKSVIDIAHEYGAEVTVAEISRGDQIALLRKLGCDKGSLFDKEFGVEEMRIELLGPGRF